MNAAKDEIEALLRLAPDMASLRLLVLAFVRDYFGKWDASPSYGEIAAAMTPPSNRTRIRKAVKSLVADGLLLRSPGPRGLKLPDSREAALRVLRELGWRIDEDITAAFPADRREGVTNPPLLPPPELDYFAADLPASIDPGPGDD